MHGCARSCILTLFTTLLFSLTATAAQQPPVTRFRIGFPADAHADPITGRVFVMISRTNEREPRLQIGRTGVPFFGRDIEMLLAGGSGVIDESDLGSPIESLSDFPPGDYYVQGFINIYSEFRRAMTTSGRASASTSPRATSTATSGACTSTPLRDSTSNSAPPTSSPQ